jgi:hypothetical protein
VEPPPTAHLPAAAAALGRSKIAKQRQTKTESMDRQGWGIEERLGWGWVWNWIASTTSLRASAGWTRGGGASQFQDFCAAVRVQVKNSIFSGFLFGFTFTMDLQWNLRK